MTESPQYTIPQPKIPIVIYLYGGLLVCGLISVWIAAHTAFSQVMSPEQAFFAAVVVEGSALVEAFSALYSKNRIAMLALVVSLGISLTYNYIQAETIGARNGVTDPILLATLALGPIFAIVMLAAAFGTEFRKHNETKIQWAVNKQQWIDSEVARKEYQDNQFKLKTIKLTQPVNHVTAYAVDQDDARVVPQFSRGTRGFIDYLSWIESRGESFSKRTAIQDLGVVERSIDRYIAQCNEMSPNPLERVK
jgi:hypothetical protein